MLFSADLLGADLLGAFVLSALTGLIIALCNCCDATPGVKLLNMGHWWENGRKVWRTTNIFGLIGFAVGALIGGLICADPDKTRAVFTQNICQSGVLTDVSFMVMSLILGTMLNEHFAYRLFHWLGSFFE